jgi:hypothetical protein
MTVRIRRVKGAEVWVSGSRTSSSPWLAESSITRAVQALRSRPRPWRPNGSRSYTSSLTGLDVQENQARRLLDDLLGFREEIEAGPGRRGPIRSSRTAGWRRRTSPRSRRFPTSCAASSRRPRSTTICSSTAGSAPRSSGDDLDGRSRRELRPLRARHRPGTSACCPQKTRSCRTSASAIPSHRHSDEGALACASVLSPEPNGDAVLSVR